MDEINELKPPTYGEYRCCDDVYELCDIEKHKRHTMTVIEMSFWGSDKLRRIIRKKHLHSYWIVDAAREALDYMCTITRDIHVHMTQDCFAAGLDKLPIV